MDSRQLPVGIYTYKFILQNLDILYPQVYGMNNIKIMKKINNQIIFLVNNLIAEQGYYNNPMTDVIGTYELKTNQREILSLIITNYTYVPHAAHGMTINKPLTFDITSGKDYKLKNLFKENSDYVKILSEIVLQQIKQRDIQLLEEFKGIKSDQDYYIDDKSLVIYFQLYEITPYALGFQYFPISIYDIQNIIDENGILSKMLY